VRARNGYAKPNKGRPVGDQDEGVNSEAFDVGGPCLLFETITVRGSEQQRRRQKQWERECFKVDEKSDAGKFRLRSLRKKLIAIKLHGHATGEY